VSETQAPATGAKPGKVQAIAIMTLIDGIASILGAFFWVIFILSGVIGTAGLGFPLLVCCVAPIYSLVVGIMDLVFAAKLLPDPPKTNEFSKPVAIMEIVNILSFNVLSVVTGILSLVFANDPEVIAYFATVPPPPQVGGAQ
jgi:hypothetical protein